MKKRFQIMLSLITTGLIAIGFSFFTYLTQEYIYRELVEQAMADNLAVGESVLSLLSKIHSEEEEEEQSRIISSLQHTCDILKLPNGGYVCAANAKGMLVAAPGFNPGDQAQTANFYDMEFVPLDRSKKLNYGDILKNRTFSGFFENTAMQYSDVIATVPHKSGIQIFVHQNNKIIKEKAKTYTQNLLLLGITISVIIGIISFLLVNQQVVRYETKIENQQSEILSAYSQIEKKNTQIISSINYAKRIQNAILPPEETLNHLLGKDKYFILFKPKDIVSGDFYWITTAPNTSKIVLAVADCTGHGVPGAFMSMIGYAILNNIVLGRDVEDSSTILEQLRTDLQLALRQTENDSRDGMDIVVLVIDKAKQKAQFSGAMSSLYYVQNGELKEIKGDKIPVGGVYKKESLLFTPYDIAIDVPTTFYLTSDGFVDQFGGTDNKKFSSSSFRKLLTDVCDSPMAEQAQKLLQTFEAWKGNTPQTDDISIFGVKID